MAQATLYGPNGQKQVVTVGSQQASSLQSQGWGLTPGSYKSPAAAKQATLYGPNGQKQVVTVGSQQASALQSQGWGLTAPAASSKSTTPVAIPNPSEIKNYNVTGTSADGKTLMGTPKTGTAAATTTPTRTQSSEDSNYNSTVAADPNISTLVKSNPGSTVEQITEGLKSGNLSGIVNSAGQPFSAADQAAALAQGMKDNAAYYAAQQANDTNTAQNSLAQNQANYNDYIKNQGQNFQTDKTAADQSAADNGILFSGARTQKQNNLARAYTEDQATALRNATSNVNTTANNFQYKYGNTAANGLSQYYQLGSNSYNPASATAGVTSNSLSSVYNPSAYDYQGAVNNEQLANAQTTAAGLLWNQGNKLVATGNANKY